MEKLAKARAAEANCDPDARKIRNQAKKSAKKDRVNWTHSQLLSDPSGERNGLWKTVRSQKRGFQGKRNHLVVGGKAVPWSRTHLAFRDHLEQEQWGIRPRRLPNQELRQNPIHPQTQDDNNFSLEELQAALTKLRKGRAPGPDQVTPDLLKLLDHNAEKILLDHYNQVWETGIVPQNWLDAVVVSIYKGKGLDTDPSNYRPISLLNSLYKLFAAMLQSRLSAQHEQNLRATQYGFRTKKSTSQPLFILRRAMEWSEMTNNHLHFLFLDWKQAFDSIDHNAMLHALGRFGLSARALAVIQGLYSSPRFYTTGQRDHTASGEVKAGIRQGCPLSPYLFVMVLTVLMEDVDDRLLQTGTPTNTWSVSHPTYDLEYADDTLLMALTTTQLQSFLTTVEQEADLYGMRLNQEKTEILTHPKKTPPTIRFLDGSKVPTTTQTRYLGSMISWERPFEAAFYHRASLAETAYKKLRLIWNSRLSQRRKLYIFQTTFVPILTYGLATLSLKDAQLKRVDAFYHRFLRRIFGIKATYYSRISNQEVWEKALRPQLPSAIISGFQFSTLKEAFLSDYSDPVHNVMFSSAHRDRIIIKGRRRGMQIPYFLETTTRRHFPSHWTNDPGRGILGPHVAYAAINRTLAASERAPMRASTVRARR